MRTVRISDDFLDRVRTDGYAIMEGFLRDVALRYPGIDIDPYLGSDHAGLRM